MNEDATGRGRRAVSSVRVFASLTSLDPVALEDRVARLVQAGVDGIHVDIADGHFAPFLLYGPAVACSLASRLAVPIEAHLMVDSPEAYLPELAAARVARVAFHLESTRYPWRVVSLARSVGVGVGVALNALTTIEMLRDLGAAVDYANLLGTDHDLAGDRLLPATIGRVRAVRALVGDAVRVQVDGGVDEGNAAVLVGAGADDLVIGRALCGAPDWPLAMRRLREQLDPAAATPGAAAL